MGYGRPQGSARSAVTGALSHPAAVDHCTKLSGLVQIRETGWRLIPHTASEQRGNTLKGFKDFHLEQGQNLALTVLYVPYSLDSGSNTTGPMALPDPPCPPTPHPGIVAGWCTACVHSTLWCAQHALVSGNRCILAVDRLMGTAGAEDARGTPTPSHISPSILVYEDQRVHSTS